MSGSVSHFKWHKGGPGHTHKPCAPESFNEQEGGIYFYILGHVADNDGSNSQSDTFVTGRDNVRFITEGTGAYSGAREPGYAQFPQAVTLPLKFSFTTGFAITARKCAQCNAFCTPAAARRLVANSAGRWTGASPSRRMSLRFASAPSMHTGVPSLSKG